MVALYTRRQHRALPKYVEQTSIRVLQTTFKEVRSSNRSSLWKSPAYPASIGGEVRGFGDERGCGAGAWVVIDHKQQSWEITSGGNVKIRCIGGHSVWGVPGGSQKKQNKNRKVTDEGWKYSQTKHVLEMRIFVW